MKKMTLIAGAALLACTVVPVAARTVTFTKSDGSTLTADLPEEAAALAEANAAAIASALESNGVSQADLDTIASGVTTAYSAAESIVGTATPYTTAIGGLNDFTDVLVDVIPNTQGLQNVWSESWIGYILPKPNFGFGVNAGISSMDISPLADTATALGMDAGDVPDTLVFPTITADARVGGFILPFDVGLVVSSIDSAKLGLNSTIDPVSFNYYTVGADVRYCVWKFPLPQIRVSVGAGLYYTSGKVEAEDSSADATLEFDSTTLSLSAQASAKLLMFVPFAGARVMFSKTNVDWSVKDVRWTSILGDTYADSIGKAVSYGILPTSFNGGSSSDFFDDVRPVLYGGVSLDLLLIDITVSGSYDLLAEIPSGALSIRLAL